MRAREFQIPAALAGLLTTTTAVDMATVAMPLDLGFGDISHKVIFELAGRFEILGTAMGTLLRTDVVFGEYGPWWRLRSKGPRVLAVFLATPVRAGRFGVVAAFLGVLLALVNLLEFVLPLLQPTPQLSVFRFQLGDSSAKLFLVVHDPGSLREDPEKGKTNYLTVTNPSIPRKQVYDLASCRFLREGRDVLWLGPPGVGKSFMVQAIGYQAIKAGYTVYYRSIFDLVRDFLHDEVLGQEDKMLKKYLKPELLVIDDMGMKQLPRRSGECLFEVVMRRYETRSTMMTSNRPLEDWGKLLGDAPGAGAILDRFLHHAELVQMTGRSYRLRHHPASVPESAEDSKPANAPPSSVARRP